MTQWIEWGPLLWGQFPVRAHAVQVPSWGCARDNQSMYLSHMDVSLPLFLPPVPSL